MFCVGIPVLSMPYATKNTPYRTGYTCRKSISTRTFIHHNERNQYTPMQDINTTFRQQGYVVEPNVYTGAEVATLIAAIEAAPAIGANYRGGAQPFAIRSFLQEVPAVLPLVANAALKQLLQQVVGAGYHAVRAIYFNKPPIANWLVPWHQDLTISVKERAPVAGYSGWTSKNGYMSVCPPAQVLERIVTLRIHLDDATAANGALQVLPGSHIWGITRKEDTPIAPTAGQLVPVPAGGVMLMRPLLFHASQRTNNHAHRRVIHIELSDVLLPHPLQWAERVTLF